MEGRLLMVLMRIFILFLLAWQIVFASGKPGIGLVLSGGGARGFAHIGTLKMIDSLNIPVDYIAGTSMGGIIAALYASGYSGDKIEEIARSSDWNELFTDRPSRSELPYLQKKDDGKFQIELGIEGFTPVIPGGLIGGQKIALRFANLVTTPEGMNNFDELHIPFRCVAVDLLSGKEVVLKKGPLSRAMRATMAIPTVFTPVEWGDSLLVDGGILNNFPADVAEEMGAEVIIGVNVGTPLQGKEELESIMAILNQTMVITDYQKQKKNLELCEFVIHPELTGYSTGDFEMKKVNRIIDAGILAAREHYDNFIALKKQHIEPFLNTNMVPRQKETYQKPVIFEVRIVGNKRLPYLFIYRLLGIKPSDTFDINLLNERISYLYGLGYFEKIDYEIQRVNDEAIRLIITVREKPLRRLQIGFRYDDEYRLIGMLGILATNVPFPGIRMNAIHEFSGLLRTEYTLAYPSRQLNLPVFPYIRLSYKDIPVDIFDPFNGDKIAEYDDRAFTAGGGFGFLLSNDGILELEYHEEHVNINPDIAGLDPEYFPSWKDRLRKFRMDLTIDQRDDVILPRNGLFINIMHDISSEVFSTDSSYHQLKAQFDLHNTPFARHTFHLQGFVTTYRGALPVYKFILNGGPHNFIGMKYNQIEGHRYGYLRAGYRYEHKKDIFLKLIANAGLFDKARSFGFSRQKLFYGYGFGIKLLSIIGPFELTISRGSRSFGNNDNMQTQIYVTHGFIF